MTSTTPCRFACVLSLVALVALGVLGVSGERTHREVRAQEAPMHVRFLEIVTPEMDLTCETLAAAHGVKFSDPVPEFGNSRTAELKDGGILSVRAPMHEAENTTVRPYILTDDIHAAVKAAEDNGATIAHPPLEIPGRGTFAIYFLGGIEHGLWQD